MRHPALRVPKTNAMRLLDARGIPYRVTEYDPQQSFHDAVEVAALVGAPVETVFKTLVVLDDARARQPLLVLVPAHRKVDLRRLATSLGAKRFRMATQREAERLTGLRVGGISALAVRDRAFEVILDASARALATVHVSAGVRGMDVELAVEDLVAVTGAVVMDCATAD